MYYIMYQEDKPNPFPLNPIYNPNDWPGSRPVLIDVAFLDANYLKYPVAQGGTEILSSVIVNGSTDLNTLFVSGTSSFENAITMSSTVANNRQITSSYYNINDINGVIGRSSRMYQDGINLLISNDATSGKTRFSCKDAGGTAINIMEMESLLGTTYYRPLVILANNNFTMNSGSGVINQAIVSGDVSNKNVFKLSDFALNSNNTNGTATTFEFYDAINGKGVFLIPNSNNGSLSDTNRRNDCCFTSRASQDNNAITISNWNSNMRNGLRIFTTDINNCGLTLQCGQNTTSDWAEFRMAYNRATLTTTTTFNNVINFNPTTPIATTSVRRRLEGLGTLSFTDISGNGINTTNGSITSAIWTDSSLVSGLGRGMFLDCSINGGDIIFRTNDTNGVKSTSLALNGDLNTTYNRLYQELNPSWSRVNGYHELAKDAYPTLNPKSSGVSSVSTWTTRTTSIDLSYYSVAWSPELSLFCAVAETGSGGTGIDRVITSPDGISWTQRNCFAQGWRYVIWASELGLFVASCITGTTTQRIMTSPDGINWTLRTTPNDNNWRGIAWSPELSLLVCVADSGAERVMTSPDGVVWTSRNQINTNGWNSVCWSAELGIFVAVGNSGTGTRVMTSPDGTTWTLRTSAADIIWRSIVWASELGLFVAVASSGSNNRVMTSTNGINWTSRTTINNGYREICWSPQLKLFCAVADSGSSNLVMTSPDGINWTSRTTNNNIWLGVCWSPELGIFCSCAASGTNDRIMTSSLQGRPPTNFNVFDSSSNIISETGDWTLQANTIYATQLDIRRNYTTPLSRLEIVNDGANSSYIKSRAPTGQSVLFLNTYNGASDDEVMNLRSTNIGVRRPIQFNYLTTPNASNQLGWFNSVNIIGSAYSTQTAPNSMGEIILASGTWKIEANFSFTASGNHTYSVFSYALSSANNTFPTTLPYTIAYIQEPGLNINTNTATRQVNLTLQLSATTSIFLLERVTFTGGGTTNISVNYGITRIG